MEAAASIVVSPALQVIFDRLASPVLQKAADIFGFNDNFRSLQHALVRAQATLEDAEGQQFTNKAVKLWLSKLKKAADDAEDDLDYLTAKDDQNGMFPFLSPFSFQIGALMNAAQIGDILRALETTVNEGLREFNFKGPSMVDSRSTTRETCSFVVPSDIYGRDDDKEMLVKLLLSSEAYQEGYATCIPVIGIGGIGKTTLAQLAYNDERVVQQFDLRMWTFVSQDFNVKKIMKTIIESATKDECKFSSIDLLVSELWHLLHNKRYLLVLDDVWTEDHNNWDKLRLLFRGGVDGCKIIITTRSKKIPLMMDTPVSPYYLKGLSEDDCWALFKQRAFARGEEEKFPNLSLLGKQIVKKCGGVPLAAKSLGSLMRFKREDKQWLFMQNSDLWKLDLSQHSILPALMLSYLHLPSHLRQCFAFCSIFPKNYEFKKEKLIHLWMAEGFILQGGGKRPEDIGDEYFTELLWMSLFQEVELCDRGGLIGYKMNDVIHDLARYVANSESVILEHGVPSNDLSQIRHASVVYTYGEIRIPKSLYEAKHLRTILLIGESGSLGENLAESFPFSMYLRVLDLNSCNIVALPQSLRFNSMVCLRYLDFSHTPINMLPESICNLCYLQTLNLVGCYNLRRLPYLGMLTGLRHLNITGCVSLIEMPLGFQRLRQLQKLPLYVVRGQRIQTLVDLEHLDLYGKLNITNLDNADNSHPARLKMKENLESLGLYWGTNLGFEDVDESFGKSKVVLPSSFDFRSLALRAAQGHQKAEEILEGLQPHQNLKKLVINGYPGIRYPDWTLPNLIAVSLTNCASFERLPALGNLLLLKTLSLHGMHGVKQIGTEFYGDGISIHFSSLEELSISGFRNLEDWSSVNDRNAFPRLRKLIVNKCPKLAHVPLPQSLQHLELRDCNPTLMSIENMTLLSTLVIENIPDLVSLPEGLFASAHLSSLKILSCPKLHMLPLEMGNLLALKSLTLRHCAELSSLPQSLQNLKALESLEISDCPKIISMPDNGIRGLSSLRILSLEDCNNLTSLSSSLENVSFLEHLTIMNCPYLGSFPDGMQHLSVLRSLTIMSCTWFDTLPESLQNVRTLHCLEISSCPRLTALPEWIENLASLRSLTIFDCPNIKLLPQGIKLLTKLQFLSIQECPELEQRCTQGSGEDWLKIVDVPHRYIGSPQVSQTSKASTSGSSSV